MFPSDGAGDWVKKVWERVPPPKIGGGKVGVDRIAGGVTLPRPCSSVPRPVIARSSPESAKGCDVAISGLRWASFLSSAYPIASGFRTAELRRARFFQKPRTECLDFGTGCSRAGSHPLKFQHWTRP